jgi:1,2-diacylglycerol 3-alpha-glucosyltransferase
LKILHICLASFYIDNYSYQENMLPKFHKKNGFDVEIIASLVTFDENGKVCLKRNSTNYVNEYGIPVTRLEYKKFKISKRLRRYVCTYEAIKKSNPDIIFIHGCQFFDIKCVVKYVKQNSQVRVYVDNHADFSNSARTWISKNILHKIIWKRCAHLIEPYTIKFYGVLPARVDFLKNVYKLPEEKIELLVMGADDEKISEARNENTIEMIREKYNIKKEDFLIMTGGKIDQNKPQTLLLMEAVKELNLKNVLLIVFGSIIPEFKEKIELLLCDSVKFIGWVDSNDTYKYFNAAELVVFPGKHSVFWEQVVGLGKPCIFRYMEGFTHIDLSGNCKFLYCDSVEEIKSIINEIVTNKKIYENMKKNAFEKGNDEFCYSEIAQKSIKK